MSLHRACCCGGLSGDCPCHLVYGGRASYTATWTGTVTATSPTCACVYGLYGPASGDPATYADKVSPTQNWSAQGYPATVTWDSTDPLNANFCRLSGSRSLADITIQPVELFDGNCTDYGASYNIATNLSIVVLAPDPDNGRDYWEADCAMTAMLRVKFRSTQGSCFPTSWSVYSVITAPPQGCNDFRGIASWSYSIGLFTLT